MALQQESVLTSNGMRAFSTTLSANTDLFASIGSLRGASNEDILRRFIAAWNENKEHALRISLYNRDVLKGQGERNTARQIWAYLAQNHPEVMRNNLHKVPELGYWKDVLSFFNTPVEAEALALIAEGLSEKNGLCAKWMPRKGDIANKIRKFLNLTPKEYRKTLVELTKVVETQMCAKDWENINYSHVPSKASKLYRKAFKKHDNDRYQGFLTAVEKGEAKINAKALYPYDIVGEYLTKYNSTLDRTLEAQWLALPNFLEGSNVNFMCVCDVSGSMQTSAKPSPMNVCLSLGIYLAQRNTGPFKDAFITFSSNPQLQVLKGNNLKENIDQLARAEWGMSTDIEKVFKLILKTAVVNRLSASELPQMILIMSDMQFNACTSHSDATAFGMIEREFRANGYNMPQLVFWNLNAVASHVPVSYNQQGVSLVSGFSPSIMKQLLSGGNLTPEKIMLDTIMNERYNVVL